MATSISIDLRSVTETSISVAFNVEVTYAATYKIKYGISETGDSKTSGEFTLSAGGTYTTYASTFSSLKAGTTYTVWCSLYNAGTGAELGITDTLSVTTSGTASIEVWDWAKSNGSATVAQTQAAYSALLLKGNVADFSYRVWNDLVNKANEVIVANGGSWDSTYGTLSATLMSASDKRMTAKRYNAVWYQFNQSAPVSRGDEMMASYFLALANAINRAIS